jgi:hypothetical protein
MNTLYPKFSLQGGLKIFSNRDKIAKKGLVINF